MRKNDDEFKPTNFSSAHFLKRLETSTVKTERKSDSDDYEDDDDDDESRISSSPDLRMMKGSEEITKKKGRINTLVKSLYSLFIREERGKETGEEKAKAGGLELDLGWFLLTLLSHV